MTVFYDINKQRWVAQVGGFTDRPKKRTRFADTEHDALLAEQQLKAERNQLKAAQTADRKSADLAGYCTDADEFSLIHWIRYTTENKWRSGEGTMAANAMRVATRTDPKTDIRRIDLDWCEAFVRMCRDKHNLGDPTIQNHLNALFVVLKQANRRGAIDRVPLRPEGLEESVPSDFIPEDHWVDALIEELGRQTYARPRNRRSIQLFCMFLRMTGVRTREALRLQWSDVSMTRLTLKLRHKPRDGQKIKNKQTHELPIMPELESLFIELKKLNPERPFPFNYHLWWEHFAAARELVVCNLRLPESVLQDWVGHRFRAMCITELADAGWEAFDIMSWANHSDIRMSQRYVTKSAKRLSRLRNLRQSQPLQSSQLVAATCNPCNQHQTSVSD